MNNRITRAVVFIAIAVALVFGCETNDDGDQDSSIAKTIIDEPFLQEQSETYFFRPSPRGYDPESSRPFYAVEWVDGTLYCGGPEGITRKEGLNSEIIYGEQTIYSLFYDADSKVLYAGGENAIFTVKGGQVETILISGAGKVRAMDIANKTLWLACDAGLYFGESGNFSQHQGIGSRVVYDVSVDSAGVVWIGTRGGLFRVEGNQINSWSSESNLLSDRVFAVAVDLDDGIWIGTNRGLQHRLASGDFESFTGAQGLCVELITALKVDQKNGDLWIGTSRGAIRKKEDQWNYYAGRRWIGNDYVQSLAIHPENREVWIATGNGVSRISEKMWTLFDKAMMYEKGIRQRHDRLLGYVSQSALGLPGSLLHNRMKDSDNDGLWTGMYLASLCFRYAVTKEQEVRELAREHFNAMAFLEEVTMRPGLIARSVVPYGEKSMDPACYPYCQWQGNSELGYDWKSDASSDEMTGHFYAYSVYYDLIANGDERQKVIELVHRLGSHLIDNDFYLVDWDGEPTTWGIWNPETLYEWWTYRYGDPDPARVIGLVYSNSLQILSFMRSAYHVTGDEKFLEAYYELANTWGLADIMVNAAVHFPGVTNHSTDELIFLAYYPLLQYEKDPVLLQKYLDSLRRTFGFNRIENSSFFNFTFGALTKGQEDFGQAEAIDNLKNIPLDLVTWTVQNSLRDDATFDLFPNRFGEEISDTSKPPLPPDERRMMIWNGDPFTLDGGNGGYSEDAGTFYLLPYWMGRYYGFISKPTE